MQHCAKGDSKSQSTLDWNRFENYLNRFLEVKYSRIEGSRGGEFFYSSERR